MKIRNWVFLAWTVCLLLVTGCSRSGKPVLDAREYFGVKVNSPRLDTDFTNASPAVQATVDSIKRAYRYGQFPQAMVELDKLSGDPSLNEAQKKLVNELIDQTKQVITKTGSQAGQ